MPLKLIICQTVVNRLKNLKNECNGKLYGVLHKNTLLIIGFYIIDINKSDIIHGFPTEIDLFGVFEFTSNSLNESNVKDLLKDIDVTDTPLYMICHNKSDISIETYFNVNNRFEKVNFEIITEQDIYSRFIHIQLMADIPFTSGVTIDSIEEGFEILRKQLTHGQMVFNFPKTNIYLMGNNCENGLIGIAGDPTVGEICKESTVISEGCSANSKKKKNANFELDILRVVMLKKLTREYSSDNVKLHAPTFIINKSEFQSLTLPLHIDALSLVNKDTKVVDLYMMLVESCCRYLRLLENKLIKNLKDCNDNKISEPETYHFFSENCGHFITRLYNKDDSEENLVNARKSLHVQLALPLNRPIFRRANRYSFKNNNQESDLLINPHEGVSMSGNGGEVAIIRGKYSYYHYCQNKMDDAGWGCAYRSLQTLASWFSLQGYTNTSVPTFTDIQKCLVDIGDKPYNFVGSKQWIGSTEVNFVLDSLLNITSKLIYVSSGEDMATKGPELINHFKFHGSPVMIGGGVLAHTILGVDYNNITGDIQFLILDPHYTGSEDLDIIIKKGWCGWKGVEFWDKTAYYNMCLPQVPTCI